MLRFITSPVWSFRAVINLGAAALNHHILNAFLGASALKNEKINENPLFSAEKSYLLWSLRLEPANMSKIDPFSESVVFYA